MEPFDPNKREIKLHPYLPKARQIVDFVSTKLPHLAADLQAWYEAGETGMWYGDPKPSDIHITREVQLEPRPSPLRPAWAVRTCLSVIFMEDGENPPVQLMFKVTPEFTKDDFAWATLARSKEAVKFLSRQITSAQVAQGVFNRAFREVGAKVTQT